MTEAAAGGVRRGFEACDATDAYARVTESYAIEVGLRNTIERSAKRRRASPTSRSTTRARRSAPTCAGQPARLRRLALPRKCSRGPTIPTCGSCRSAACRGRRARRAASARRRDRNEKQSLLFRRQAGLVAESIYRRQRPAAPARAVARARGRARPSTRSAAGHAVAGEGPRQVRRRDRPARSPSGSKSTRDSRATRGCSATRVEWQEARGHRLPQRRRAARVAPPPQIERAQRPRPADAARQAPGRRRADALGDRRGEATGDPCEIDFDFTPGVVVQDDAKVGIGTDATAASSRSRSTIRTIGDNGDAIGLQAADGEHRLADQSSAPARRAQLHAERSDASRASSSATTATSASAR